MMRKHLVGILFFIGWSFSCIGQYGNEWINYDNFFYCMDVTEDGLYRLTYNSLKDAGVDVDAIDPRTIQMFSKGEEIPIYIQGEQDGIFEEGDYVEFFGERNDGYYDKEMYDDPEHHFNPYKSLYTDTTKYYFSWDEQSFINRRVKLEKDQSFNAYSAVPFFWEEIIVTRHEGKSFDQNKYNKGHRLPTTGEGWAEFSEGEGWFWKGTYMSNLDVVQDLAFENAYLGGPQAILKSSCHGNGNNKEFQGDHGIKVSFDGNVIIDTLIEGYSSFDVETSFSISETDWVGQYIMDGNTVDYIGETYGGDKVLAPYLYVKYPHTMDMNDVNKSKLILEDSDDEKLYFKLTNFNSGGKPPVVYDIVNGKLLKSAEENGEVQFLLPNPGENGVCFISSEEEVDTILDIKPVTGDAKFTNYLENESGYIIVSHSFLWEPALNYYEYRVETGHNPVLTDINQLYHQYGHGQWGNPIAIRKLCAQMVDEFENAPEHLFLLGNAVNLKFLREGSKIKHKSKNFVPTWGSPGSDQLITAGLGEEDQFVPKIPVGRLAAITPEQVDWYLLKVKQHEESISDPWRKEVIHLGGGLDDEDARRFANFLELLEVKIKDTLAGSNVHTFLKESIDPIHINISDSLTSTINNGISMITYFGHSWSGGFDEGLDVPGNYKNDGKYPLIYANSCNIGNIHFEVENSGSEEWVLQNQKGAIAFMGSITRGIDAGLLSYSERFYDEIGKNSYNATLAKQMKEALKSLNIQEDQLQRATGLLMTLHGDPAIKLWDYPYPDYSLFNKGGNLMISTEPAIVSADLDSFKLDMVISNFGKAIDTTFTIRIKQQNSNRNFDTIVGVDAPSYKDTLSVTIYIDPQKDIGYNQFTVELDDPIPGTIEEIKEDNNMSNYEVNINSNDLIPIYPYNYSVIPEKIISLKASTVNPTSEENQFIFQIDTNENFTSPLSIAKIKSKGGVVSWNPYDDPQLFQIFNSAEDSSVFFWRVSIDTIGNTNEEFNWHISSFQYIQGKYGWGQAHFHQIDNDKLSFLSAGQSNRQIEFKEQIKRLHAQNTKNYKDQGHFKVKYDIDGSVLGLSSKWNGHQLFVVVIDYETLEPWKAEDYDFGEINIGGGGKNNLSGPYNKNHFCYDATDDQDYLDITNLFKTIPDSTYVLMYPYKTVYYDRWPQEFWEELNSLGADTSTWNAGRTQNFIFFSQKGNTDKYQFSSGVSDSLIHLYADMENNFTNGKIISTSIGPAKEWRSMHWRSYQDNIQEKDSFNLTVYGIDQSNTPSIVIDNLQPNGDKLDLNQIIDAEEYEYLELQMYVEDDSLKTPYQLDRWQVLYEGAMELAVNPNLSGYSISDTVERGTEFRLVLPIENVSEYDADSVQVSYWLVDEYSGVHKSNYQLFDSLKAGEVLYDTIEINSINLSGNIRIWVEVNPLQGPREWQLEQYHFNNIYEHSFFVRGENVNPILDVTFDGIHILDGDIISPTSEVLIMLKDENPNLALNDTSLVEVYLKKSDELDFQVKRVYYTNIDERLFIEFSPANLPENECFVRGNFNLDDGKYELLIRAKDRLRNQSGDGTDDRFDYRINFEIISKSTVTEVMNYPNPFSTSTRFVYTLTGSDFPDDFRIQILTISGKVIKELDLMESSNMRIGRNISDVYWDGTDDYGDPVGNGIYLYRVIVRKDGDNVEKRESGADFYFDKGFGKMYLMR